MKIESKIVLGIVRLIELSGVKDPEFGCNPVLGLDYYEEWGPCFINGMTGEILRPTFKSLIDSVRCYLEVKQALR